MRGVFAITRDVFDHPVFAREPYTEREAWLWMLAQAAWKPHRVSVRNAIIELKRGQLAFATRFMADKWGWSEARVRRFLGRLKNDGMVDAQPDAHATLVTICNYDKYQRVSAPSDAEADAKATRTRRAQRREIDAHSDAHSDAEEAPVKAHKNRENSVDGSSSDALSDAHSDAKSTHPVKRNRRKEEDRKYTEPNGSAVSPEKAYFDRGKQVLGKQAGGLLASLLKAKGGEVALARAAVETASTKQDPREYLAAIVRGRPPPDAPKGAKTNPDGTFERFSL